MQTEASVPPIDVPTTMWGGPFPTAISGAFANGIAFPGATNGGGFTNGSNGQLGLGGSGNGSGWDPMRNGPQPFLGGAAYPHLLGGAAFPTG